MENSLISPLKSISELLLPGTFIIYHDLQAHYRNSQKQNVFISISSAQQGDPITQIILQFFILNKFRLLNFLILLKKGLFLIQVQILPLLFT